MAQQLVYAKEHPWLVTLQSNVDYECDPITVMGCFETLPCQCSYGPRASPSPGVLSFQSLDSADSFNVDVGSLPEALSQGELWRYSLAVSTGSVFGDFTVAIGLSGYTSSVRYLVLRGGD